MQELQWKSLYKLIGKINKKIIGIDENYSEEPWFTETCEKFPSFKLKVHTNLMRRDSSFKKKSNSNLLFLDQNRLVQPVHQDLDHR